MILVWGSVQVCIFGVYHRKVKTRLIMMMSQPNYIEAFFVVVVVAMIIVVVVVIVVVVKVCC